jgi:hypothetical protein
MGTAEVLSDRIELDLTGDEGTESVRVCTSREGAWLTVWAGIPFESERLEAIYIPLGYDVAPTCRPDEVP